MTYVEAQRWAAYMEKHGTLNFNVRLELGVAMICTLICRAMGTKKELRDFMINRYDEDGDGDATLEDIMSILAGAKRDGK